MALEQVFVKVIGDLKLIQTSKIVQSINAAYSSMAGKVLVARMLES
jgi:hypothetical protein